MKKRFLMIATAGLLVSVSPVLAAPFFRTIQASNLNGREFVVPTDLAGEVNLVLIAFQREQQALVDTWFPEAARLEQEYSHLEYYELPTISRLNPFARWFIDRGMRSGIPDRGMRARTITLYLDKAAFRESLEIPHEDTIYAMLIDRTGRVLWTAEGEFDAQKGEGLEEAVRTSWSRPWARDLGQGSTG
jgi:hypothetical protein